MKKGETSLKKPNVHYLILLDHDGTLCNTSPFAYESMKFGFQLACQSLDINFNQLSINWDFLFKSTQGTTEKNLVRTFCYLCGVPPSKINYFEERYYNSRVIWFKNMKSLKENPYDIYYPDAENLINICRRKKNISVWLLTGNPKDVIKERMARHLLGFFTNNNGSLNGAFGDEALERTELILKAIFQAQQKIKQFKLIKDKLGFISNVVYIGDGKKIFIML